MTFDGFPISFGIAGNGLFTDANTVLAGQYARSGSGNTFGTLDDFTVASFPNRRRSFCSRWVPWRWRVLRGSAAGRSSCTRFSTSVRWSLFQPCLQSCHRRPVWTLAAVVSRPECLRAEGLTCT